MLSRCFLDFSVGVRASVIGLSQISSFSLISTLKWILFGVWVLKVIACNNPSLNLGFCISIRIMYTIIY